MELLVEAELGVVTPLRIGLYLGQVRMDRQRLGMFIAACIDLQVEVGLAGDQLKQLGGAQGIGVIAQSAAAHGDGTAGAGKDLLEDGEAHRGWAGEQFGNIAVAENARPALQLMLALE